MTVNTSCSPRSKSSDQKFSLARGLDQFHGDGEPSRPARHRAAGDIVDIEPPPGLLRPEALIAEREHRAFGDDEEAAQLGETRDDVVCEAARGLAAPSSRSGTASKGMTASETARRTGRDFIRPLSMLAPKQPR